MPTGIPIIETFLGFPSRNRKDVYKFLAPHLRDDESKEFKFPAQYMFKDVPEDLDDNVDPVAVVLDNLDRFGIERGMIGVGPEQGGRPAAPSRDHPDRFIPSHRRRPQRRHGRGARDRAGTSSTASRPSPRSRPAAQVADQRQALLSRSTPSAASSTSRSSAAPACPGPRVPIEPQKVELIDEVCWFFPELTFVMRHGGEPWTDLAVKLMLKWPNLYYSTSAFAPRHYPKAIIDYANTRGADKILYAGYFPAGPAPTTASGGDMPTSPFKDEVWPKFLRENALKVLKLDG